MSIKEILNQQDFKFNKQFGQNFLTDQNLLSAIVRDAEVTNEDCVLEIGAGAGTLTKAIASVAKNVVAYEIDRNLEPVLAVVLQDCQNVKVEIADVMKHSMVDIEAKLPTAKYKVVANIPYYITTPLIMRFIEETQNAESLTLTIQKEVAERLSAQHNTKNYGAISVAVQAVADVKTTRILSRQLFYPVPNVDSAVVHIKLNRNKFAIDDIAVFRKTVKSAFAMRRKTLSNNLSATFGISKDVAVELIESLGLPATIRGEALSVAQFVELANKLTIE